MKSVNTLFRTDEKIDLEALHNLICYAIDEEQFVVLTDLNTQSFIQMAELGEKFIIEYCCYNFLKQAQYYRLYVDEPKQAYIYFEQFYHHVYLDVTHWLAYHY